MIMSIEKNAREMDDEVKERGRDCIMGSSYAKARLSTLLEGQQKAFSSKLKQPNKKRAKTKTPQRSNSEMSGISKLGEAFLQDHFLITSIHATEIISHLKHWLSYS